MKILFYAINGVGFGHVNVTVAAAEAIRKVRPDWDFLFVTNSRFTGLLGKKGFNFIQLPLHELDITTKISNPTLSYYQYAQFFNSIIKVYAPDAVVYEWISPDMSINYAYDKGIKNILIWTDPTIKGYSDFINKSSLKNVDFIFVPLTEDYLLTTGITKTIINTLKKRGVIIGGPIVRNRDEVLKKEENPRGFNILVLGGGGGWYDANKFLNRAYDACKKLRDKYSDVYCRIITGPFYYRQFAAVDNRLIVEDFVYDLLSLMQQSDLVISNSGYSICNELMLTKTPALLVPAFRYIEDQKERAIYMKKKGLAEVLNDTRDIFSRLSYIYKNRAVINKMRASYKKFRLLRGTDVFARNVVSLLENTLYVNFGEKFPSIRSISRYTNIVFNGRKIPRHFIKYLNSIRSKAKLKVVQLHTNDPSLSKEAFLDELIKGGVNSFMVDIYGRVAKDHDSVYKKKGDFYAMLDCIKMLLQKKAHVVANHYITDDNLNNAYGVLKFLTNIGLRHVQLIVSDLKKDASEQKQFIGKILYGKTGIHKYIYFTQSPYCMQSLNLRRHYQLMRVDASSKIVSLDYSENALLDSSRIKKLLTLYDDKIADLQTRFAEAYSNYNVFEESLETAKEERVAVMRRASSKEINLVALDSKISRLIAHLYSSPELIAATITDMMKTRDAALIEDRLFHQFLKFENKISPLKSAYESYYSNSIKPLKEELLRVINAKDELLIRSGLKGKIKRINDKKQLFSAEINEIDAQLRSL